MRRFAGLLIVLMAGSSISLAQDVQRSNGLRMGPELKVVSNPSDVQRLHITHLLLESESGKTSLEAFQTAKKAGKTGQNTISASYTPGSTKTFLVRNASSNPNTQFESIHFTLVKQDPLFNIWVETAQLKANGGFVETSDTDQMAVALGQETPTGSFRSDHGIIENDEFVFGNPPDKDGDGITDVLLLNIRDDYNPSQGQHSAVLGFFDPQDLNGNNNADIIYIDTIPGMFTLQGNRKNPEEVHQTTAHEYQHLIFANYNGIDETFVNEGLAEWAEVMNGYTARPITYLSNPSEHANQLFLWRSGGGPDAQDYQRAGLFTTYISERIGVVDMGRITRSTGTGHANYVTAFSALGLPPDFLKTVIGGFHTATAVNNAAIAPDYGFVTPQYGSVGASGYQTVDGESTNSTNASGTLSPGAVKYIRWNTVGDFSITITAGSGSSENQARMSPLLFVKPTGGPARVEEITYSTEVGLVEEGNFDYVIAILPHVDLTKTAMTWSISANWEDYEATSQFQSVVYDDGFAAQNEDDLFLGFALNESSWPGQSLLANRFEIPANGVLSDVSVSVYYMTNFAGQNPTSTVKNFRLGIWDDDGGEPGTEVLHVDVSDTSPTPAPEMAFMNVDLSPYQSTLAQLDGLLYVSVGNAGTDDNYIFVPRSNTSETDLPSYLYYPFSGPFSWGSFNTVTSGGNQAFPGTTVPIRANFLIGTSSEDDVDVPQTFTLEQNYPNPFNPSTSIGFTLPRSGNVRLAIYDMLGREVALVREGILPAGRHDVTFNASSLSSGLYIYALESDGNRMARTMMLIK